MIDELYLCITLNKAFDKQSKQNIWMTLKLLEFYEGEFNNEKIASIMMKAGLNGLFSGTNCSVVREIFHEMRCVLVGEGKSSRIEAIDLLR